MKKEQFTIQVSEMIFDLAVAGKINVIAANLDPQADKELQEGRKPETVAIKARGTRKHAVVFSVIGSDTVQKGYQVATKGGRTIDVMSRNTGRVVIGNRISETKEADEQGAEEA